MTETTDWRMTEARNQTIFREMNEWTKEDVIRIGRDGLSRDIYLCECGDGACTAPISLNPTEYEAVRSEPTWFAIAVDHENPELDSVLVEYERYSLVDKSYGPGARLARASDPRR
jgi:hypothetical protein